MTEPADTRREILHEAATATAQQVATIVLVLGLARNDASTDARVALKRVEQAARTALAELRLLTRVLGPAGATADGGPAAVLPSRVATDCVARLRAAGLPCRWDVPDASDALPETVRTTLAGLMRCVRDVGLGADPAPLRVDLRVVVGASEVELDAHVAGILAPGAGEDGLGPVTDRVRISGGDVVMRSAPSPPGGGPGWELVAWLRCS